MKIERLMIKKPATCRPDDTLEEAARILWENDVGALPVLDHEGTPIAMVTDRDICMAAYTQGAVLRTLRVSSAMSKRLLSVSPDTTMTEVESLMRDNQIRRVPVVDVGGQLLGIVTLGDLARHAEHHRIQKPIEGLGLVKTLAGIVERRHPPPS